MNDRIDTRLLKQLDSLQDHEVVNAVIAFQPGSPSDAEAMARAIVQEASRIAGAAPTQLHIQPRLATMFVSAPCCLVRQLIADGRVSAASADGE
jgi:hypothetical protein